MAHLTRSELRAAVRGRQCVAATASETYLSEPCNGALLGDSLILSGSPRRPRNVAVLDPEIVPGFPNSAAVNKALHSLAEIAGTLASRASGRSGSLISK